MEKGELDPKKVFNQMNTIWKGKEIVALQVRVRSLHPMDQVITLPQTKQLRCVRKNDLNRYILH